MLSLLVLLTVGGTIEPAPEAFVGVCEICEAAPLEPAPPETKKTRVKRFFRRQGIRALLVGIFPAFAVASAVRRTREPLRFWGAAFKAGTIDQ